MFRSCACLNGPSSTRTCDNGNVVTCAAAAARRLPFTTTTASTHARRMAALRGTTPLVRVLIDRHSDHSQPPTPNLQAESICCGFWHLGIGDWELDASNHIDTTSGQTHHRRY